MTPRPARALETVGCDVGGTTIQLVRLARDRAQETLEIETPRDGGASRFLDLLVASLRALGGAPTGVALPGFLDGRRRRIVHLSNLPFLDGLDLARRLERRLRAPIVLDADTNAGAVAEARLGAARGRKRVLYVTMGTGLGAALVVSGMPVRASRHTVGQVAHMALRNVGPDARTRSGDCAERILSARGVVARYRAAGGRRSLRSALAVREAAAHGEAAATAAWEETGRYLGVLLRALIPLFQPDTVVVGGGLAGAAPEFLPETRRYLRRNLPAPHAGRVDLRPAALGRYAGAVGAALLARDVLERR